MVPPRSLVSARWQLFGIAEETSWVRFFTKYTKNGLLIQMIYNGGGFFVSYPKPDTLEA